MPDKCDVGLYSKFIVRRCDGRDAAGEKHHGCDYFVLDLTHDPFARDAALAYATACRDQYPLLAMDLIEKVAIAKRQAGEVPS